MIRLRTLGSVDLRGADGLQVEAVLRQPKRLALLIYLAFGGPIFHRRDRILALFWPESDEKGARGSLSQSLFQLRAALGKDLITSRGDDEIGIGSGTLWCDVAAFDDALRNHRPAEAMALYAGELLPSFVVADAPEFQNWLDEQRTALRTRAAAACIELAEEAERARDVRATETWLRRAVAIDRFSEPTHQRLISLLDRVGNRAAALHAYNELSELLRTEFESEPAAESIALIRNVRARAQPQILEAVPGVENVHVEADEANVSTRRRRISRGPFAILSGILVVAAVVWSALAARPPKVYHPPTDRVAVLYFNDESAHRDLGYLAESLTSTLIDQLGQVRKIQVISQNGVRPFRGDTVPLDSIARQLDVGTIVGGSITRSNDRLRVTVELIDGATGIVVQSRKLERPNGELFALLDELSNEVSSFLRTTVGQEVKLRQWGAETKSVDAWSALQQAEYLRTEANDRDRDGKMAEAATLLMRADSLAMNALAIDRRFASALLLRGRIAEQRAWMSLVIDQPPASAKYLVAANRLTNAALAIDPRNAAGYELRGSINQAVWFLHPPAAADSLLGAAEHDLREAIKFGGERPHAQSLLSSVLYVRGHFAEARTAARRALDADAYLTEADQLVNRLFQTSFELKDDAEAGHWCDEVRRRFTGHWPSAYCDLWLLAWAQEGNHDPRKAMHILETFAPADAEAMRTAMRPRITMMSATVLARAGMKDSASAMMARARAAAPGDVELHQLDAAGRMMLGDEDGAVQVLRDYLKQNPTARARIERGRIFASVRDRLR